jgi:hypothetical protein
MNNGNDADDLRRQLAAARASLSRDAQAVASDARTLVNWRHHVRNHPWLAMGGAAAVGFLLAPRRRRQPAVDAATAQAPMQPVQSAAEPPKARAMAASLAATVATMLLRQSASMAGQLALAWLENRRHRHEEMEPDSAYDDPRGAAAGRGG